jgi:uroporphyrinogen-III synthase
MQVTGQTSAPRLDGRRVLVTRAAHQSRELTAALADLGADPVACPVLEIEPTDAPTPDLGTFDWVVITSPNGVDALADRLGETPWPETTRLAVVGVGTAARAERQGWTVSLVPRMASGEALGESLATFDLAEARVLRVRGDLAPAVVEQALTTGGAEVEVLTTYRTVSIAPPPAVVEALERREIDAVTFASGSAITALLEATSGLDLPGWLPAACIGPVTTTAAQAANWSRVVTAEDTGAAAIAAAVGALLDPGA